MSNYLPVTLGQASCVQKMANEKGIGRAIFQTALDDGSFSRFLDRLKIPPLDLRPPQNARVHVVRVRLEIGAPLRRDRYIPVGMREIEEDLVLINYTDGQGSMERAQAWAQEMGLKRTIWCEVYAIGELYPMLNDELQENLISVVATTFDKGDTTEQAYCRFESGKVTEERAAALFSLHRSECWFAFRKEK